MPLTVGTLNLWGRWADWPARLAALEATWPEPSPDVLLLQEVRCDGLGDQSDEVADAVGYPERVSIEGHRTDDGREGIAIVSRVPLLDVRDELLPTSEPARRILFARVEIDGDLVSVACGHTVAVPEDVRAEQVRALLATTEDPLVLGADLNEVPDVVGPLIEEAGLEDALHGDEVATWPMCRQTFGEAWRSQIGRAPHFSLEQRRLDYLLTRGMEVLGAGVEHLRGEDGTYASDHALVWATVSASPARSAPAVGASRRSSDRSPTSFAASSRGPRGAAG
jgi:endonuclease/exonuclease/phosphatase family metal-dependent hydrolase